MSLVRSTGKLGLALVVLALAAFVSVAQPPDRNKPSIDPTEKARNFKPELKEAYKKWTVRRKTKHGYTVKCRKGLWGVESPTKDGAEREGRHYFALYFSDGDDFVSRRLRAER